MRVLTTWDVRGRAFLYAQVLCFNPHNNFGATNNIDIPVFFFKKVKLIILVFGFLKQISEMKPEM